MSGAQIVPFPLLPADRLSAALSRLEQAQERQRTALAQFRAALGGLREETGRLQRSVGDWDGEVRRVGRAVAAAQDAARTLERTAARM